MRKRFLLAMLSVTLVLPIISHASDSSHQATSEQAMATMHGYKDKQRVNKPIVLFASRSEPIVMVQLSSNPSTGYKWYMAKVDDDAIEDITQSFARGEVQGNGGSPMVGVAGTSTWKITLDDDAFDYPQQIRLLLLYKPPGKTVEQMIKQPVFIFTSDGK